MHEFNNALTACVLALLFTQMGACGSADERPGAGGSAGRADAGPSADATIASPDATPAPDAELPPDAAVNSAGPTVLVLSPSAPAAGDFSSEAIISDGRFTARCRALANPDSLIPVDTNSVVMSATLGAQSFETLAQPTNTPGEYEADLVVSDFPNGTLTVTCTASELSEGALQNSDTVGTFLDLGPTIAFLAPAAGASHANQTEIEFTVSPAPVSAGDTLATPDFANVVVQVSGLQVTDVNVSVVNASGTFSGTLVFDDPAFFPGLDGEQTVTVRAPNLRTSAATIREASVTFNADSQGPLITPVAPLPGELVTGIIAISANVTDLHGILANSVVATIAGIHEVELVTLGGDTYTGFFETRLLGPMIFPNIIIRARDIAGNQSSSGYVIALDNVSPTISLDPPPLRESRPSIATDGIVCSLQFDPLGRDAVSDRQTVPQLFEVRARVEDDPNQGNSGGNDIFIPRAEVDPSSVQLFVLDDENAALIVDVDGDGFCDEINPLLVPTSVPSASDEVAAIDMAAVPSGGASTFDGDKAPFFADTGNGSCEEETVLPLPDDVCGTVELTRVIAKDGVDAIYGVPPVGGLQCLGNALDALAMNLSDGWSCMAVRAEDNLGNINVSAVLRMCIDSDGSGDDGCAPMGDFAVSGFTDCTGTYDFATDTVDATTPCIVNASFDENQVLPLD